MAVDQRVRKMGVAIPVETRPQELERWRQKNEARKQAKEPVSKEPEGSSKGPSSESL